MLHKKYKLLTGPISLPAHVGSLLVSIMKRYCYFFETYNQFEIFASSPVELKLISALHGTFEWLSVKLTVDSLFNG